MEKPKPSLMKSGRVSEIFDDVQMDEDLRKKRNEYIYHSFRDVADCDYICARTLHRIRLFDQFLWSGLQAIEKYLKTIVLLYDGDTRNID